MDFLGIDITSLPYPTFLAVVMLIVGSLWFLNVFLPLVEENKTYKEKEVEYLTVIETSVNNVIAQLLEFQEREKVYHDEIYKILEELDNIIHSLDNLEYNVEKCDEKEMGTKLSIDSRLDQIINKIDILKERIWFLSTQTQFKDGRGNVPPSSDNC